MNRLPLTTARQIGLSLLCLVSLTIVAAADPLISEFLASNQDSLKDEDGDTSDWIEIRNSSSGAINLAGFALTDDPAVPEKWVFPDHVLPGNGFLIVFASGKDRRTPGNELHTNFRLAASGGYLALFRPGLPDPMSAYPDYPPQLPDVSYGEGANTRTITAVTTGAPCRWLIPNSNISNWTFRTYNDSSWASGSTGVGYEVSSSNTYDPLIGPGGNVQAQMYNRRTSAYIRIPFDLADASAVSNMLLRMKFDDGFTAFINGQEVATSRAPVPLNWNSLATLHHDDDDAQVFENFQIAPVPDNLVDGENVLAIHGLNRALDSSDFIILPELDVTTSAIESENVGFHTPATPGAVNNPSVDGLVEDTKFSVNRGFFSAPFPVEITTATEGAQIRYTTDGSAPTSTSGLIYSAPLTISTTTVLRAAAFKPGFAPTNVDTQTYLFTSSIRNQLEMDPEITNSAAYSSLMDVALRGNIPTISLATRRSNLFGSGGIYTNSQNSGRSAEVPVSVEYFSDNDSGEFQIDAGIRIHGGNARSHPKKPLRLYFRRDYGAAKLRFPLFPDSPVDVFDQLLLRGGGHDSWSLADVFGRADSDLPPHGTIMRDQFLRRSEVDMGILSPRGKYVHVYINGEYWGVYDLHERANEDFFADHLGGEPEDYDVLHHPEFIGEDYSLVSGSDTAWNQMQDLATAGIFNESQYQAIQEYLDIDAYIIAMMTRMWSGDYDWCGPIYEGNTNETRFDNKNWYAGRRSRNGDGKFLFFCWDAEMSMGLHLKPFGAQRVTNFDLTRANDSGSPVALYNRLRSYREFRMRFADLLQKHLFHEGAMSTANNQARLAAMEDEIEDAMIAESARWGDEGFGGDVFDRNDEWRSEVSWLKNVFIAGRNATLISQFRARGVFPTVDAPTFSRRGGEVPADSTLTLSGSGGAIYYTTDGSDPRLVGGGISPSASIYTGAIPLEGPVITVRARLRASATNWSAIDEAQFIVGQAASASNLAITEFHYHPANPSTPAELAISSDDTDFEFIEITNTSSSTVNLSGVHFTQGISFLFDTDSASDELAAGESLLVVSNREAFLARYGQSLAPLIAGTFGNGSKLSNNGENLTLADAFGSTIATIPYTDSSPWPEAADGDGPSLVLNDPVASIDASLPTSWRASVLPGGSPGTTGFPSYQSWARALFDPESPDFDTISAPGADPDDDRLSNLAEFALARSPLVAERSPAASPARVSVFGRDYPGLSYRSWPQIDGITITVETSRDLVNWTSSGLLRNGSPVPQNDGTVLTTYRLGTQLQGTPPSYFRLRIETDQ